jgi:hypothetical protein
MIGPEARSHPVDDLQIYNPQSKITNVKAGAVSHLPASREREV